MSQISELRKTCMVSLREFASTKIDDNIITTLFSMIGFLLGIETYTADTVTSAMKSSQFFAILKLSERDRFIGIAVLKDQAAWLIDTVSPGEEYDDAVRKMLWTLMPRDSANKPIGYFCADVEKHEDEKTQSLAVLWRLFLLGDSQPKWQSLPVRPPELRKFFKGMACEGEYQYYPTLVRVAKTKANLPHPRFVHTTPFDDLKRNTDYKYTIKIENIMQPSRSRNYEQKIAGARLIVRERKQVCTVY